jgi:hypothetical protein
MSSTDATVTFSVPCSGDAGEGLDPRDSLWALLTGQNVDLSGGDAEELLRQWSANPHARRAEILSLAATLRGELLSTPADVVLSEELIQKLALADLLLRHQP